MRVLFFFSVMCIVFSSCKRKIQGDLLEIPVDISQDISLHLSKISEEVLAIELELTDESLVHPDRGRTARIFLSENYVIVVQTRNIFVFNHEGKFIRTIGARGQGPGEYTFILSAALDKKNNRLFVGTDSKIIYYDLNGNLISESEIPTGWHISDMNYIDGELLLAVEQIKSDEKGHFKHSAIYWMDDNLQVTESFTIRKDYFERPGTFTNFFRDFILHRNSIVYLYYSDLYFQHMQNPAVVVLRDTLYRVENNQLVPELRLRFRNDGVDAGGTKFIELFNIYRSSRFVFAVYSDNRSGTFFHFVFDTKTGIGYNMQDGFTVDGIASRVSIRPLNTNPEMFYFWYTHMEYDDMEEPNPTLYIRRLKK